MAGIKDQLLKSGLVNDKQLKKTAREQRKDVQQSRQQGKLTEQESQRIKLLEAQQAKQQKDRALELFRKQASDKKAVDAQIRQLLSHTALTQTDGELVYNFTDASTVKRLHLTGEIRDHLMRELLGIVKHDQKYHIVPRETVEKIRERNPAVVIQLNSRTLTEDESDQEDPYAKYQVPDDLIW